MNINCAFLVERIRRRVSGKGRRFAQENERNGFLVRQRALAAVQLLLM
jgi:hypothetical protein